MTYNPTINQEQWDMFIQHCSENNFDLYEAGYMGQTFSECDGPDDQQFIYHYLTLYQLI